MTARAAVRITGWALAAAAAAILVLTVVVPRLVGATPYTILTGSMAPELPPGSMVVVRPAVAGQVAIGDVVTYQLRSGESTLVTHRVVGQTIDQEGVPLFKTQGDANSIADEGWVRPVQIRGEVWYSIPYLGRLAAVLPTEQKETGMRAAGALLLGYALLAVGRELRRRERHPRARSHVSA